MGSRGKGFWVAGGVVLVLVAAWLFRPPAPDGAAWQAETAERYEAFWQGLEQDAAAAAEQLAPLLGSAAGEGPAADKLFAVLAEAARQSSRPDFAPRPSLLLLSPDGDAVAWAGKGLQHEPVPAQRRTAASSSAG